MLLLATGLSATATRRRIVLHTGLTLPRQLMEYEPMPNEGSLLQTAVIFLFAAVLAVPLAKRLQLGAVLGYLLAGVVIGPQALGLIRDTESVAHTSELGVVLLLFIIGLELSPKRLWLMRKSVFGVGSAQVLLTGAIIGAIALFGFAQPLPAAVVLGLGLALSSTALGLQSLAEAKQLNAPHGRLAFAILLFQDIAAIPLIAVVPLLAASGPDTSHSDSLAHALKVFASIAVVIVGGRYLLRPVFRTVARTGLPEVSTATALLVVIGTAWLMEEAGVSMALGAFLAGLLLADSEYRHELESQIEPFKGLLLGLFFISVGMGANLRLLLEMPWVLLGLTLLLVAVKLVLLIGVGRLAGGLNSTSALRLGMVLAAGGEFAFVVFKLGKDQGLFDTLTYDLLLMTITLSMAVTPLLMLGCARALKRPQPAPAREIPEQYKTIDAGTPRVVIVGMGRMFEQAPVFYGDPLRPEVLHAAKVGEAEYLVITIDDPEATTRTAERVKRLYPHLKVLARARNRQHVHKLVDVGAEPIRETFYSSLEMTRRALIGLGLSAEQAADRIQRFTQHDEEVLVAQGQVRDDRAKVMQTAKEARVELERLFDSDTE